MYVSVMAKGRGIAYALLFWNVSWSASFTMIVGRPCLEYLTQLLHIVEQVYIAAPGLVPKHTETNVCGTLII
jgi:hypothetical protein